MGGAAAALNPSMALSGATLGAGKGGKAPSAPDFGAAAEAQAGSGRINQQGPFGSVNWSQGQDGRWNQTMALSPEIQAGVSGLEGQIANQGPLETGEAARQAATDATYGQFASRLDPQWQQRENDFRSQMAAQGLDPGSEAYNNAFGNFSRGRNDAYQSAQNAAVREGLGAQDLQFRQSLAAQNAPYQQLNALHGLTSGMTGQGPQTQYLPGAMAAYQGALQGYGIDQAQKNSMMNGLGGLGSSAAMLALL